LELWIFYFPFSPVQKMEVDYVPSNFVKSQELKMASSCLSQIPL
jgi:hypothetical protein